MPPYAHLLFSERVIANWRARMRPDGRMTWTEMGLNRLTLARFERLVADSPFRVERLAFVPIRPARALYCRWTREYLTSTVRCTLLAWRQDRSRH